MLSLLSILVGLVIFDVPVSIVENLELLRVEHFFTNSGIALRNESQSGHIFVVYLLDLNFHVPLEALHNHQSLRSFVSESRDLNRDGV